MVSGVDSPLPELDRYIALEELGAGGMATIYMAQRRSTHALCALKLMHDEYLIRPDVRARFLKEAMITSRLQHQNIGRLLDAGQDGETLYMAMELIQGQTLATLISRFLKKERVLAPALSLGIALDVLDALQYAHELADDDGHSLRLVHRDLSPSNIMVTYEGVAKIIDFGLVRFDLGSHRTQPGVVLGTPRYMSPEQISGKPVDHRSDLYTWMVTVYEMLSGVPLVSPKQYKDTAHAIMTEPPPLVSKLLPNLPLALDEVFAKALAKSKEDRFSSAVELSLALRRAAPDLLSTHVESRLRRVMANQFDAERQRMDRMIRKFGPKTTESVVREMYPQTQTDFEHPDLSISRSHPESSRPLPTTPSSKKRKRKISVIRVLVFVLPMLSAAWALMLIQARGTDSTRTAPVPSRPPAIPPSPSVVAHPRPKAAAKPPAPEEQTEQSLPSEKRTIRRVPSPAPSPSLPNSSQVRLIRQLKKRVLNAAPSQLPPLFDETNQVIQKLPKGQLRSDATVQWQLSLQAGDADGLMQVLDMLERKLKSL